MTKKELVKAIADELNIQQETAKKVIQRVFDGIIDALVKEGRMELRNFGIFEVKQRKARKGRNPRSGEEVEVPERAVVRFKPGLEMEERVGKVALSVGK
jgi:nucleoid DNA-binding protein